ncbi:MAG: putative snf2 family helicase [Anaerolineales bacterium]|nr:putative snf2 family helicase [Anaerolineales bacterium]
MTASLTPSELRVSNRAALVLEAALAGNYPSPERYRLQLAAEHLALIAGFDELICLEALRFQPFDYQIGAAQAVLRRFRGRGLLCDEVGLGKTIEAGLVLKEYLARQMVQRVLILTPPALVEQWREELAVKFNLPDFVTSASDEFREHGAAAWARFPRVVASLATARRAEHRAQIEFLPYDLVIVDEAHHLKNRASVSWKFANNLQKRYLLLLTATPVQNNLDELYNLITLLKPGQLQTPREFQRQFVTQGDPRLPKNRGRLRELLADVMVRHARGQVGVLLPPRRAHTLRLSLSPDERAFYDEVSDFIRVTLAIAPQDSPTPEGAGARAKSAARFTLQTLQREIDSSPHAAQSTLLSLAEAPAMSAHRATLLELAERAARIQTWAKADALEKLLQSIRGEKILLFTHFRQTLERLAARLRALDLNFVVYHGSLSTENKDAAIRRFEGEAQILLSTEAAGEGRNLQFCRTMVNFDLPWNPLRIEQRVGRIHRIGQTRPVEIYNLAAAGTIEDYLLDILDRKVNMFELVIGEMDMILGELTEAQDFEDLLFDVWTRARDEAEVQAGMEQLGDTLVAARAAYQKTREYDEALFGQDFVAE